MTNTKKILYLIFVLFVLVCAIAVPVYADHGRGHVRGSIWIGPLWWGAGPWWEPYPYPYYASPPVVIQQQAPIYEQPAPQPEQQQYYWYFCADSRAYYPYVKECPGGWMKVIPAPASPK